VKRAAQRPVVITTPNAVPTNNSGGGKIRYLIMMSIGRCA